MIEGEGHSTLLAAEGVRFGYPDGEDVIKGVDFAPGAGEIVALIGPNGAGKSTLIKACLGLVPRASGQVEFWGKPHRKARSRIGYVPQRETVDWDFPVSALDVVCMGRYRKIGWCRPVQTVLDGMDLLASAGGKQPVHVIFGELWQRVAQRTGHSRHARSPQGFAATRTGQCGEFAVHSIPGSQCW